MSKPSEGTHRMVGEGSRQKQAGRKAHLRGWRVMEALRVIASLRLCYRLK